MTLIEVDSPLRGWWRRRRPTTGTTRAPIAELDYAVERGGDRRDLEPGHRRRGDEEGAGALGAARPRARDRAPDLVRGRAHLGADRGDGRPRRGDPRARCSSREDGRKGRLSLQTNPANYRDPARMLEQAVHFATPRAEHPGQVPDDRRRPRGDRGGDGSRRRRSTRRSRSPSPRRSPSGEAVERGLRRLRGGRRRREPVQPGVLAHGRAARRLDEGPRRARRHRPRPRRRQLGGHRRVQARVRHLPGAGLPHPAARRRVPPPAALDRARRRRRRPDDAARVAGAVQRERDRPGVPDRRPRRPGDRRRPAARGSRTSSAPTSPTASRSTSSRRTARSARTLRGVRRPATTTCRASIRDIVLPNPDVRAG